MHLLCCGNIFDVQPLPVKALIAQSGSEPAADVITDKTNKDSEVLLIMLASPAAITDQVTSEQFIII